MAAGLLGGSPVWRGCCDGSVGPLDALVPCLLCLLGCCLGLCCLCFCCIHLHSKMMHHLFRQRQSCKQQNTQAHSTSHREHYSMLPFAS